MTKAKTLATLVSNNNPLADGTLSVGDVTGLQAELDAKQAALVSGTNIKTVNGNSLLGSGNIQIDGGVTSFNTRTGAVTLSSGDVTSALGYTPLSNATSYLPLAGGTMTGAITFAAGQTWPTFNQNTTGNAATATTATNQSGGTVNATTGAFSGEVTFAGGSKVSSTGDVYARRSNGSTGVYYFVDTTKYLYYDGTNFHFSGGGLYVGGVQVRTGTGAIAIADGGTGGTTAATGLRNQWVGSWQRETNGGTMVPGNTYSVWTGGGAVTMYLPTIGNCQNGDKIYIQNLHLHWATNNFTIARSDANTLIMQLAENLVCNVNVGSIVLTCVWDDGSTASWNVAPGG